MKTHMHRRTCTHTHTHIHTHTHTHLYASAMVLRALPAMGVTTVSTTIFLSSSESSEIRPFSPMMAEHLESTISEAPFVKSLYPPPGRGITVDMLLRAELNVNTLVNDSVG